MIYLGLVLWMFGNGIQSNTTVSQKVYLVTIMDNYMFRPVLAIFRLSYENLRSYYKKENLRSYYTYSL